MNQGLIFHPAVEVEPKPQFRVSFNNVPTYWTTDSMRELEKYVKKVVTDRLKHDRTQPIEIKVERVKITQKG